jgi:predicted AAA+ superfamily ATPase
MTMLKSYRSIYQQDPKFLVFDEIQTLQNWSHFLRTLHNKKYQIIITGSSSKLLLNEIATELRGRYSHTLILPFSFPEYLEYKGIDLNNLSYLSQTGVIDGAFTEYMQYGGFPAIINEEASQKRKMLMEYYDTIYYKDILERYTIRDKRLVENFMKYLLDMYSSILSPAKLADYLKKEGKG